MLTVILTYGLPASGKSTWARKMLENNPGKYTLITKDDLRDALHLGYYCKSNERVILAVRDAAILAALEQGQHIIIADTNLARTKEGKIKHLENIKTLVKQHDTPVQVKLKDFSDVPLEECVRRDAERENPVGEKVIRDMHQRFIADYQFRLEQDDSLPKAIIIDLDGTYALFRGDVPKEVRRNPYDASTCENDIVNPAVDAIVQKFMADTTIIFMSGRKSSYREATEKWIKKNNIHYDYLHMRGYRDQRPDHEVKRELFYEHVSGRYNVLFVLDDRNSTVDGWRRLGLDCFQVNYGNF